MSFSGGYCRCCYSSEELETLYGPALDTYMIICNAQDVNNDGNQIKTCPRCCEFLNEVHRFRMKCHAIDEIFRNNSDVKHFNVELMLKNAIDDKKSQLDIKTEPIDEYDEIDHIDVQINKAEVDSNPKNSYEMLESPFVTNVVERENQLHDSGDLFECGNCTFKCKEEQHMISHQVVHSKRKLMILVDKCDGNDKIPKMKVNSKGKRTIKEFYVPLEPNGDLTAYETNHDNPFKCSKCSFSSTKKKILTVHYSSRHCEDRPFSCDQCDYRAKLKYNLYAHQRKHMIDRPRPFACSECSYKAKTKRHLLSHVTLKHREERPFLCDQCMYRFKLKSHLTKHINRKHSKQH